MTPHFIYLVRHGVAADLGPEYSLDDVRPLTKEGVERFRLEVRGLAELDVRLDCVLTSPLLRAAQTAEILASGLECAAPLVTVEALRPGGRYDTLLAALGRLGDVRSVALVGHMPSIGQMAARLVGASEPLAFKKGAVCCIETTALPPSDAGQLRWFMPPRALRALGR